MTNVKIRTNGKPSRRATVAFETMASPGLRPTAASTPLQRKGPASQHDVEDERTVAKKRKLGDSSKKSDYESTFIDNVQKLTDTSMQLSKNILTRSMYKKSLRLSTRKNESKKKRENSNKTESDDKIKQSSVAKSNRTSDSKRSFVKRKLYSIVSNYTDSESVQANETSFLNNLDKKSVGNVYSVSNKNAKKCVRSDSPSSKSSTRTCSTRIKQCLRKTNQTTKKYFTNDDGIDFCSLESVPKEKASRHIQILLDKINGNNNWNKQKQIDANNICNVKLGDTEKNKTKHDSVDNCNSEQDSDLFILDDSKIINNKRDKKSKRVANKSKQISHAKPKNVSNSSKKKTSKISLVPKKRSENTSFKKRSRHSSSSKNVRKTSTNTVLKKMTVETKEKNKKSRKSPDLNTKKPLETKISSSDSMKRATIDLGGSSCFNVKQNFNHKKHIVDANSQKNGCGKEIQSQMTEYCNSIVPYGMSYTDSTILFNNEVCSKNDVTFKTGSSFSTCRSIANASNNLHNFKIPSVPLRKNIRMRNENQWSDISRGSGCSMFSKQNYVETFQVNEFIKKGSIHQYYKRPPLCERPVLQTNTFMLRVPTFSQSRRPSVFSCFSRNNTNLQVSLKSNQQHGYNGGVMSRNIFQNTNFSEIGILENKRTNNVNPKNMRLYDFNYLTAKDLIKNRNMLCAAKNVQHATVNTQFSNNYRHERLNQLHGQEYTLENNFLDNETLNIQNRNMLCAAKNIQHAPVNSQSSNNYRHERVNQLRGQERTFENNFLDNETSNIQNRNMLCAAKNVQHAPVNSQSSNNYRHEHVNQLHGQEYTLENNFLDNETSNIQNRNMLCAAKNVQHAPVNSQSSNNYRHERVNQLHGQERTLENNFLDNETSNIQSTNPLPSENMNKESYSPPFSSSSPGNTTVLSPIIQFTGNKRLKATGTQKHRVQLSTRFVNDNTTYEKQNIIDGNITEKTLESNTNFEISSILNKENQMSFKSNFLEMNKRQNVRNIESEVLKQKETAESQLFGRSKNVVESNDSLDDSWMTVEKNPNNYSPWRKF